jgi:hypothetical protein
MAQDMTFNVPLVLFKSRRYGTPMTGIKGPLKSAAFGLAGIAATLSAPTWAAPQIPLAAGSYEQLSIVMAAADQCGFRSYRVQESAFSYKYLYTNDDLGSYPCIQSWLKKSAQALGLSPRYEGDTYQR